MACFVLSHLLKKQENLPDTKSRGNWWYRLCIDLKHLKLRKECLKVAQYALLNDQGSVKSGIQSGLFKIHDQLQKQMSKPKAPKKKKKKAIEQENEEDPLQPKDMMGEMILEM